MLLLWLSMLALIPFEFGTVETLSDLQQAGSVVLSEGLSEPSLIFVVHRVTHISPCSAPSDLASLVLYQQILHLCNTQCSTLPCTREQADGSVQRVPAPSRCVLRFMP